MSVRDVVDPKPSALLDPPTGTVDTSRGCARRTVPFVLVTDMLPAVVAGQPTIGLCGLSDDPVTAALMAVGSGRRVGWVGRGASVATAAPATRWYEVAVLEDDAHHHARHAWDTIWPLYHDLVRPAAHDQQSRRAYRQLNNAFATTIANATAPGGTVWVHDFQLQLVPGRLRQLRPDLRVGFSLHTPFPSTDLFRQMPMHPDIIKSLLSVDVLSFQTNQAAENFLRVATDLRRAETAYSYPGDLPRVGVLPTSVDIPAINRLADEQRCQQRAAELRAALGNPRLVVLSMDTSDESDGVQRRLQAIREMYRSRELTPHEVTFLQILTPRPGRATAADARADIAGEVARINGSFATVGRPCIHYVMDNPDLAGRLALYRAADLMMATPLRAGTTLTALEFAAACRPDAALVLSEFSGAAATLTEAFLVNPYDREQLRTAALAALTATSDERARRVQAMRNSVGGHDCHSWARSFLFALQTNHDCWTHGVYLQDQTVLPPLNQRRSPHNDRWSAAVHAEELA